MRFNTYQNLLRFRYNAIGFIALINLIFFINYALRETLYLNTDVIPRLGTERIDIFLILVYIMISITIFGVSWKRGSKHSVAASNWRGNKLPLMAIFAACITVYVFLLIGAPMNYLDVHIQLGKSSVGHKLLGIVYIILGYTSIMALVKGDIRRFIFWFAPYVILVLLMLGMRSLYISVISLVVMVFVFSGRAMLWAPVIFVAILAGAIVRGGNYTLDVLILQAGLLVWGPAYQIDVYTNQLELKNLVSMSYVDAGGGVGSFIALDFEQYIPFANGLLMTSLFPASLFMLKKSPISNAVIIAIALFYPIAVRNNIESYLPTLLLFIAGAIAVMLRLTPKRLSDKCASQYIKNE